MEKTFLTMIPGIVGAEYKSNAEKKVFTYLKETGLEGYAFHSVGLPEHEKKSYSEADFIVVTRYGVLCLEVKGGAVECQDGVWIFKDRYGNRNRKNEGPFDQAVGALFAFKTALINRFFWAKNISFATGIVFPDIIFDYRGVSVIPEIIYDFGSTKSFAEYINDCHTYWDERNRRVYPTLTDDQIKEIKCFIRDDLHYVPSLGSVVNSVESELVRLTEEQIQLLTGLETNKRLIVNGPAGSGKTLLAFDYAKKCVENGQRVLYLVYNKMLALFLKTKYDSDNLTIKHFHGLITDYVPLNPNCVKDPAYYSNTLPDQFIKYLSSHKLALYDTIVIDEGQDLISVKNINVFDKLLKGGLYNGKWVLFYDRNQNIFNTNRFDKGLDLLETYRPATFSLSINCRNTESIATFNKYCSGINGGKAIVQGNDVEFCSYSEQDFSTQIDILLDRLFDSNLQKQDIIILSPVGFEKSEIVKYNGKYKQDIEIFNGYVVKERIGYSTIQSFKGLDSKVIIAIDIAQLIQERRQVVLYTLISRARTMLYVVAPNETEKKIKEKILLNISKIKD